MTVFYKLQSKEAVKPGSPLHWYNFYPDKQRHHRSSMDRRQDLILFLANLHQSAWSPSKPRSFNSVKLKLTALREWVYDYRPALDYFFDVVQTGYSLQDGSFELSTLIPKRLPEQLAIEVEEAELLFKPDPLPTEDGLVVSKVYIELSMEQQAALIEKIERSGRFDLVPVVRWLFTQNGEVNFYFKPSGKLKQRDTSVWPIHGIETWPSWLREELFGPGIDIDSAYTQFLMQHLRQIYIDRPGLLKMLYPDLLALIDNKQAWRHELCTQVLGLKWSDENLSIVKTVCMSLANGSRISPKIMTGGRSFSVTAQIIVEATGEITDKQLEVIGTKLAAIARQYATAKKAVCSHLLKLHPSRKNQKRVFAEYFAWEREARYLIWEGIDRHGIMVHDGIDGVPKQYLQKLPLLITQIGVRLTA